MQTAPTISGGVVTAEVDRHSTVLVVEHGHELKAGAQRVQVLAQPTSREPSRTNTNDDHILSVMARTSAIIAWRSSRGWSASVV